MAEGVIKDLSFYNDSLFESWKFEKNVSNSNYLKLKTFRKDKKIILGLLSRLQ